MSEPTNISQDLFRALAHPLRVEILRILTKGVLTATDLAKILDESISTVDYHLKVLFDYGYVERVKSEPRRGACAHFYHATSTSTLDSRRWKGLPEAVCQDLVSAALDAFVSHALAAVQAGTLGAPTGPGFHWYPMRVDEQGWLELTQLHEEVETRIKAIGSASMQRLKGSDGTSVISAFGAFEAARLSERDGK